MPELCSIKILLSASQYNTQNLYRSVEKKSRSFFSPCTGIYHVSTTSKRTSLLPHQQMSLGFRGSFLQVAERVPEMQSVRRWARQPHPAMNIAHSRLLSTLSKFCKSLYLQALRCKGVDLKPGDFATNNTTSTVNRSASWMHRLRRKAACLYLMIKFRSDALVKLPTTECLTAVGLCALTT